MERWGCKLHASFRCLNTLPCSQEPQRMAFSAASAVPWGRVSARPDRPHRPAPPRPPPRRVRTTKCSCRSSSWSEGAPPQNQEPAMRSARPRGRGPSFRLFSKWRTPSWRGRRKPGDRGDRNPEQDLPGLRPGIPDTWMEKGGRSGATVAPRCGRDPGTRGGWQAGDVPASLSLAWT